MKKKRGEGSVPPCNGNINQKHSCKSLNMSPGASLDSVAPGHSVRSEFYPMSGLSHFDLPWCIALTSGFSLPSAQETVIFCLLKMLIKPCRWVFQEL